MIFTVSSFVTNTLSSFMSRCTMPAAWTAARPRAASDPMWRQRASGAGPGVSVRISPRVRPSTNSITR